MDTNTFLVLFIAFITAETWLPILLKGIESIVKAWRCGNKS
jgi:hypothetical protein